jgi:hypothetical protein
VRGTRGNGGCAQLSASYHDHVAHPLQGNVPHHLQVYQNARESLEQLLDSYSARLAAGKRVRRMRVGLYLFLLYALRRATCQHRASIQPLLNEPSILGMAGSESVLMRSHCPIHACIVTLWLQVWVVPRLSKAWVRELAAGATCCGVARVDALKLRTQAVKACWQRLQQARNELTGTTTPLPLITPPPPTPPPDVSSMGAERTGQLPAGSSCLHVGDTQCVDSLSAAGVTGDTAGQHLSLPVGGHADVATHSSWREAAARYQPAALLTFKCVHGCGTLPPLTC